MGYDWKEIGKKEPAVVSAGILAVLNVIVLLTPWDVTAEALAGVNVAIVSVLGFFYVRPATVTKATLEDTREGRAALVVVEHNDPPNDVPPSSTLGGENDVNYRNDPPPPPLGRW